MITARELEALVERCLGEGVPPGVVARVFELDMDLVKEALRGVRVRKYGTDDLNDYMEALNWDVIEEARTTIAKGSSAEKARVMNSVLGKQMSAALKRAPEGQRDSLGKVMEMFEGMRGDGA